MVITLNALNEVEVDDCDAETYWTINGIDSDATVKKEGTQAVCGILKTSGDNDCTCTPASSKDLSGTKHLRIWFLTTVGGLLNTDALGGIQFFASDGVTTGYWYVGGSTTYKGGWKNLVIDVSKDCDAGTKPATMSAITSLGIRMNITAGGKNALNTWLDMFHICDGLTSYGDDGGGYFDLADITAIDENPSTGGYGILRSIGGVNFSTGKLVFGDGSSTNGCKFNTKAEDLVYEDRLVNTALYGFNAENNSTGTTEIIVGEKAGTAGVSGTKIRVESLTQTPKFTIDLDPSNLTTYNCQIYNLTVLDASTIDFPVTDTNREVLTCNFESCGDITVSTIIMKYCNIVSANDAGAIISSTSHQFSDNKLINCGHGIDFTVATTFGLTNCLFINNTYDLEFSAASGDLIVNATDSDPTNYEITGGGSSVTINVSADVDIEVVDSDDVAIVGARVFIEAASGGAYPSYESCSITSSGTLATVTHSAHGMFNGQTVCIRGVENDQYYNGLFTITYIDAGSYSYTMDGTPSASPATGTSITATFVLMEELTIAGGLATESVKVAGSQPIQGHIRKTSGTPIYKQSSVSGNFTTDGFSAKVTLISDE